MLSRSSTVRSGWGTLARVSVFLHVIATRTTTGRLPPPRLRFSKKFQMCTVSVAEQMPGEVTGQGGGGLCPSPAGAAPLWQPGEDRGVTPRLGESDCAF